MSAAATAPRPSKAQRPRRGVPELMGAREAAAELGVRVPNLRKVDGLPEPAWTLASGPVWPASEIRALARRRQATRNDD